MTQIAIFEQFTGLTVDRQIKAVIGMGRDKFDQLAPVFSASYATIQQERLLNKEIKNLPWGGRDPVLDTPEKQLFFTLFYLKTYPTFDVLGFHFGLSAGHARDYLVFFLRVLNLSLATLKTLPVRHLDQVKDLKQATDNNEIIIDGIEVPCVRPGDPEQQKARYSGKKKRHMLKVLTITNQARKILYLSPLFNGSTHDYAMMTAIFAPTQPWFKDFTLRADLGFLGAPKDYRFGANILLPHKKPRQSKNHPNPSLTELQKMENRAFSKIRVAVEHAMGGMKHFHCLTHRIRQHTMSLIDQFFGLSAGLWNFKSFTINSLA